MAQAQEVAQLAINARESARAARTRLEAAMGDLEAALAEQERLREEMGTLQQDIVAAEPGTEGEDAALEAAAGVTGGCPA